VAFLRTEYVHFVGRIGFRQLKDRYDRLPPPVRISLAATTVFLASFFGATLGLRFSIRPDYIRPVWPPIAVLVSALLLTPPRQWWIYLGVAVPAELAASLLANTPWQMALAMAGADWIEALVAVLLLRRLFGGAPCSVEERRQADKKVRNREQRLATLFELAPDAFYLTDVTGTIVDGNRAAQELIGYAREELIGGNLLAPNLLRPSEIPKVEALFARSAAGAPTGPDEFFLRRKDGIQVPVEIRTFPVNISGQTLLLVIACDITGRQGVREALAARMRQLEMARRVNKEIPRELDLTVHEALQRAQVERVQSEKLRALGQITGGIAHNLNNVLAIVLGQVELLKAQAGEPEVQRRLRILRTAATDGVHVIRRLQGSARWPSASLIPCNLTALVQEAVELTRPRWQDVPQRCGVVIDVRTILEAHPPILGHPVEIREVLINLIFNAVDAMPQGGLLTLAQYATPEGVALTVSDTGVGMTDEVRQHVFEPFFTTKKGRGTGLGLFLVYGIMQRHGGHIEVTSVPDKGTTFTLSFRTARPEGPA
jgi:PAS domain S-box-containing protein